MRLPAAGSSCNNAASRRPVPASRSVCASCRLSGRSRRAAWRPPAPTTFHTVWVVCDMRATAPSDERRRVSYPVSDSMSCIRRAHVPAPCAARALRSERTDGVGGRFTVQPFTPTGSPHGRSQRRHWSPSGLPPPPPTPALDSPSRHASCEHSLAIKCPRNGGSIQGGASCDVGRVGSTAFGFHVSVLRLRQRVKPILS